MTSGNSLDLLLQFHVAVSLIAIAAGLIVVYGLLQGRLLGGWNAVFLVTTVLTGITGLPLPPFGFDPPRAVGVILLVLLALAIVALHAFHLAGAWRRVYVGCAIASLYLNVFVAVTQTFQKVSFFNALAPTQKEPPFLVAQLVVLAAFVAFGVLATRRFHTPIAASA
jgi:hypothetical protein